MNTSSVPSVFYRLLASLLLVGLAACGGGGSNTAELLPLTSDASSAANVIASANSTAPANAIDPANVIASANVFPSPAATTVSPPLAGATLEFVASSAALTRDEFSSEVRNAMDTLEFKSNTRIQWFARFPSGKGVKHAYVTVVSVDSALGGASRSGVAAVAAKNHTDESGDSASDSAAATPTQFVLSPEQARELNCVGGSANTSEQYYRALGAYADATEAMAVGVAADTPRDLVEKRLYQILDEEALLPTHVADARKEARMAFRDQRSETLRACSKG